MENIISSLEENLKSLYRKAVDADIRINDLKKQGHGKFGHIFKQEDLFSIKANKFMPYLEETAAKILHLKESGDLTSHQAELETVVKQLHLLHKTLAEFKAVV
ncbi:prephenate dehydrogenase [Psychrosphaera sp. B3R10]|uniref:prephenate dehydrogenase n=1 Tax=unclassified Psychrosphaera TaxID=2641570 RepID=UPI001C07F523|nr:MULTISPECIES: prephenate dehydrogenase [unclassified Psychrosphaera]MBU2882623.1 prephenate dehydrogenase [Psychrosphaera sp. I2R16]MBU2989358.1 prephenate dehydrogenase [Psychrosphaera sp. B3R10]